MIITYEGGSCFKLQYGDTVIGYNPISKDSKIKPAKFGAELALISINHPDCNGVDSVTYGEKKPFVISGPGEYEVNGIFVRGFGTKSNYGASEHINTIYTLSLDNINICLLGLLSQSEIEKETLESLDEIDLLFVCAGGTGLVESSVAYKMAVKFEPKMIIPFSMEGDGQLKTFLKEAGEEKTIPVDKLTLKKKDLEGKTSDIVVLKSEN